MTTTDDMDLMGQIVTASVASQAATTSALERTYLTALIDAASDLGQALGMIDTISGGRLTEAEHNEVYYLARQAEDYAKMAERHLGIMDGNLSGDDA